MTIPEKTIEAAAEVIYSHCPRRRRGELSSIQWRHLNRTLQKEYIQQAKAAITAYESVRGESSPTQKGDVVEAKCEVCDSKLLSTQTYCVFCETEIEGDHMPDSSRKVDHLVDSHDMVQNQPENVQSLLDLAKEVVASGRAVHWYPVQGLVDLIRDMASALEGRGADWINDVLMCRLMNSVAEAVDSKEEGRENAFRDIIDFLIDEGKTKWKHNDVAPQSTTNTN